MKRCAMFSIAKSINQMVENHCRCLTVNLARKFGGIGPFDTFLAENHQLSSKFNLTQKCIPSPMERILSLVMEIQILQACLYCSVIHSKLKSPLACQKGSG